ncbi:aminoglycoside phosphotransferase family protein [Dactylosporangium sp. NPDC051484]|uniref:aminoglycoside phosphotransferase family protein n=1 Tax=Dactylosporangium sp. NPDC051484 TaxID=3154942 RepID=UPI00344C0EB7
MTGSRRIDWAALPPGVRTAVEGLLGGAVVDAVSLAGGFSEGVAARLRRADGRDAFLKAVSARTAPAVAGFHRREAVVTGLLPPAVPVPRLLGTHDDGDWVALLFEHVDGALPAQPWRPGDLDRVLTAATAMAHALTPSPIDASATAAPRLGGWPSLTGRDELAALTRLSPWAAGHLDELIGLEAASAATLAGDTLLHGDLYPFNVMLSARQVHIIDWPHAWVGAAHCDVLTLLSSAVLSGLDPRPRAETNPLTRRLHPREIDTFLAAHAGFLMRLAVTAGPAADPHLIGMAAALGGASLRWLRRRTS